MMIKFQQLSAFKAVYELGTMTAAAEHIHMTQPAVSRLIASLEHQLGFAVFQRIKGRLLPTDQGKAFYFEVAKAFSALETLQDSARDIRANLHGSLHINAFPMLSNSFLPGVLGRFLNTSNKLKASFTSYRSEEVLRRTEVQSCDVGFALIDPQKTIASVTTQEVRGQCVGIVPRKSKLAEKPWLSFEDLANTPFIRYENEDVSQQELDQLLHNQGVYSEDILEVSFANVAAMLVGEGVGCAIVDPFTALNAQQSGLDILVKPLQPAVPFQFHILYPALRPVSKVTKSFIEFFLSQAEEAGITLEIDEV